MKISIRVFGSTSFGNCTLVWDNKSALMIDCGFSLKYTLHNLELLNFDFSSLSGVLITHTHGDHLKPSVLNRLISEKVPIYCHEDIGEELVEKLCKLKHVNNLNVLRTFNKNGFKSGSFIVHGFEVPHDSKTGCFGYNIYSRAKTGMKKITIATDLGYPKKSIINRFVNSDAIIIEANHDLEMLENSNRSVWLKNRIKEVGHLSNVQCANMLAEIIKYSRREPKAIILAHLSQECNTNSKAHKCVKDLLDKNKYTDVELYMTHKLKANEIVHIE